MPLAAVLGFVVVARVRSSFIPDPQKVRRVVPGEHAEVPLRLVRGVGIIMFPEVRQPLTTGPGRSVIKVGVIRGSVSGLPRKRRRQGLLASSVPFPIKKLLHSLLRSDGPPIDGCERLRRIIGVEHLLGAVGLAITISIQNLKSRIRPRIVRCEITIRRLRIITHSKKRTGQRIQRIPVQIGPIFRTKDTVTVIFFGFHLFGKTRSELGPINGVGYRHQGCHN